MRQEKSEKYINKQYEKNLKTKNGIFRKKQL